MFPRKCYFTLYYFTVRGAIVGKSVLFIKSEPTKCQRRFTILLRERMASTTKLVLRSLYYDMNSS